MISPVNKNLPVTTPLLTGSRASSLGLRVWWEQSTGSNSPPSSGQGGGLLCKSSLSVNLHNSRR